MSRSMLVLPALLPACLEYKLDGASEEAHDSADTAEGPCEGDGPGEFFVVGVASGEGLLATVPSLGDGTFGAPQAVDPDGGRHATSFAVGDLDGDGWLDIAARDPSSAHLYVLTWSACTSSWAVHDQGAMDVGLEGGGDLDGDGDLDLVGLADDWSSAEVWLGEGDATFAEAPDALDISGVYSGYAVKLSAHAADLSGDLVADLVLAEFDSMGEDLSRLWIATGHGDGTFATPTLVGAVPTAVNGLDLVDLNRDGHPEVLAGLDDDGDAGQLYLSSELSASAATLGLLIDMNPSAESGTNNPGAGRVIAHDWDGDDFPDPIVSFQEDAEAPSYNSLHLLSGLSDLSLDGLRELDEVGNVSTINFAVPLEDP